MATIIKFGGQDPDRHEENCCAEVFEQFAEMNSNAAMEAVSAIEEGYNFLNEVFDSCMQRALAAGAGGVMRVYEDCVDCMGMPVGEMIRFLGEKGYETLLTGRDGDTEYFARVYVLPEVNGDPDEFNYMTVLIRVTDKGKTCEVFNDEEKWVRGDKKDFFPEG